MCTEFSFGNVKSDFLQGVHFQMHNNDLYPWTFVSSFVLNGQGSKLFNLTLKTFESKLDNLEFVEAGVKET